MSFNGNLIQSDESITRMLHLFSCVLAPAPLQWLWFCLEFSAWQPSPCLSLSLQPHHLLQRQYICKVTLQDGRQTRTLPMTRQSSPTRAFICTEILTDFCHAFFIVYDKWWLSQVEDIHTTEDPQEHYYNTHHITMKQLPVDYQHGTYLIAN